MMTQKKHTTEQDEDIYTHHRTECGHAHTIEQIEVIQTPQNRCGHTPQNRMRT